MKRSLMAAAAMAVIASPALAAANGPYVGIEGGVTIPQSTHLDILNNTTPTPPTIVTLDNGYILKNRAGWNVDVIAGYKLGLIRLEAERGYQGSKINRVDVNSELPAAVGTAAGTTVTPPNLAIGDRTRVTYLTANALLDRNLGGGFGAYAGGGVGRAWVSFSGEKANAMALTGIAGVRYAISPHLDAGVKYQYLHTGKLNFADASALNGTGFTTTATGHYNSSNVLASLVYNFNSRQAARLRAAEPVEAALPPASAPATQTCPDGSVALATSPCPAPPAPPPPGERGERGR